LERWISGGQYARSLATRFGVFAAITIGFPFFVYGVIQMSGARGIGGASGALALVLGLYLKPAIYLALAYSMLQISLRRARTIGISPLIGLCVPLLVLADLSFGITLGSFWAVGFSLGILSVAAPVSLIAAVITALTFSLLRDHEEPMTRQFARIYGVWKVLLLILMGFGLFGLLQLVSLWFFGASGMNIRIMMMRAVAYLKFFLIYPFGLLLAFAAASLALVVESRRPPADAGRNRATNSPNRSDAPLFGQRST
jgi:hypothetical protein